MLDSKLTPPRLSPNDYWIYGEVWRYHARPDDRHPALALIGATALDPGRMDAAREFAWLAPYRFKFGPPLNHEIARETLRGLTEQLDIFHEERELERVKRESERLFNQWRSQLLAKEAVESAKEAPLTFVKSKVDGRRGVFTLSGVPEGNLIGERRVVRGREGQFARARGEVESVEDNELVLYLDREERTLPSKGTLALDTFETRTAIDRQKQSLDALRFGSAAVERSELRDLVLDPAGNAPPERAVINEWFQSDLDEDKRVAVATALGSPDFFIVEGPPGTGKTTFIAELVAQELRHNPLSRILLTSQTHVALDNALERLRELPGDPRLVRLGRASNN
ncbi:MAG: AAA domain-containing protein, partial [Gammaproteobacteria bacterium]